MTKTSTPIEYFKKEAKKLFRQVEANDAEALARVQRVLKVPVKISLMRIQHVVAVESGFSKWEELIGISDIELQSVVSEKKFNKSHSNELHRRTGTPLGNFFRGPGFIPTPPHFSALANMFDKMNPKEQEQYLYEDARAEGLFDQL